MADETNDPSTDDASNTDDTETEPATATPDEATTPHDDPGHGVPAGGTRTSAAGRPLPMPALNRQQVGQLTLYFVTRSVSVELDGDAAMRLMGMWVRGRRDVDDPIDHTRSFAGFGWLAVDFDAVLAMSWLPGQGIGASRVSVDPAAPPSRA